MGPTLVISCLSQKGGVGKSTLARLIATGYAANKWRVKIADLNTKQKTSVDWVGLRLSNGFAPEIAAEPFSSIKPALAQDADLLVVDGKPDSDTTTLDAAKRSNLVIIPTGTSIDDLKPQVLFAMELQARGVQASRFLFVLNKTPDSQIAINEAKAYIRQSGFKVAETDLPMKTGYQIAQNQGKASNETNYPSLNEKAISLINEIADILS